MSDFEGRWRKGKPAHSGLGVWAAIGAAVLLVNAVTGGEAITARAAQVSALVDAAAALVRCQAARITPRGEEEKATVEPVDPAENQRCHRSIRVRRDIDGWSPRVVVRRRWSCRV